MTPNDLGDLGETQMFLSLQSFTGITKYNHQLQFTGSAHVFEEVPLFGMAVTDPGMTAAAKEQASINELQVRLAGIQNYGWLWMDVPSGNWLHSH